MGACNIHIHCVDRSLKPLHAHKSPRFVCSANVEKHLNDTLARLKIDAIDLYLVHWPIDKVWNYFCFLFSIFESWYICLLGYWCTTIHCIYKEADQQISSAHTPQGSWLTNNHSRLTHLITLTHSLTHSHSLTHTLTHSLLFFFTHPPRTPCIMAHFAGGHIPHLEPPQTQNPSKWWMSEWVRGWVPVAEWVS